MNAAQALHPTDQTLSSYGLGKLDDASAEAVNQHLESCPDCRLRVGELSSDSFLGRLRGAQGRPDSPAPVVSSLAGLSMLDAGPRSVAPPPASTLPPGLADHADYQVLRELGRGGMGVVYLAENKIMGRKEVLKVVSSHLIARRGVLDRFLAEIRNAAQLHHPNVVTAYAAIRMGESFVLAMEYVDGLDLARMVQVKGSLPVANACAFVAQAALGLQHAHEHGMVHRDIKPSNLMLTREGKRALIKVLDFGLAKLRSEGSTDRSLTNDGQMLGTPDYIAPEQISNARKADIRADIYSLGCTFYYLLTGDPPFHADSLYELFQAHHSMEATPLNLARPEVPAELAAVVSKMMAKEPARRFQDPKDVAQALKPFFKAGNVVTVGSKVDVSQMRPEETRPNRVGETLASAQLAANRTSTPAAPEKMLLQTTESEPLWQSLIAAREAEPSRTAEGTSSRTPSWLWPAVATGIFFLGFAAAWAAGVFKVKTQDGVIVVENAPTDAVVEVDGGRITITPKAGQPIRIEQPAGKHYVEVKVGEDRLLGEHVSLESGRESRLTVRLERSVATRPEPKKTPANRETVAVEKRAETPPESLPLSPSNQLQGHADVVSAELQKFQGVWSLLSTERDGRVVAQMGVENWRWTIEGDKFTTTKGESFWNRGILRIDPTKTPKELEWITTEGEGADHALGIYRFDGDVLRICRANTRPEEFKSVEGTWLTYFIRKPVPIASGEEKSSAEKGANKGEQSAPTLPSRGDILEAELKKFQGVWSVKSNKTDGRILAWIPAEDWTWTIEGDAFTLRRGETFWSRGTLKIDPTKTPKEIDWIVTEGQAQGEVTLGIYTLERDVLRICRGNTRPGEFESVAGTGNRLLYAIRAPSGK